MPFDSGKLVKHLVGLAAFIMVGVATAALYILIVGKWLDRGGDGFGLAAAIFMFPLLACTSSLFCWLPLWFLHDYRLGTMSHGRALLLGGAIGLVLAIVIAGPSGFRLRGGGPLVSYFLIVMLAAGGAAHNWAATRGRLPA